MTYTLEQADWIEPQEVTPWVDAADDPYQFVTLNRCRLTPK